MHFEKGYIYHIYNQGNNRQKVFFNRENYLYFLRKIGVYMNPYVDILAWCLMPNHFHLMVYMKTISVALSDADGMVTKQRSFNDSIGIMLRSYTNAINKQEKRTGKLFREGTKAECVNCPGGITPSFIHQDGAARMNVISPEKQYPTRCFHYIHNNPVKAKIVRSTVDWEFSSALDYAGLRHGYLINSDLAKEYVVL